MATWINTSKNTSSYSTPSRNTSSFTSQDKAPILATAGQVMGLLLALTYSGGEQLPGTEAVWINASQS